MAKEESKEPVLSDEEMRKLLKPNPTAEQVLQILQSKYAANSSSSCKVLQQLDSYDDCNFKVEIDNTPYLFKVHNGVESRDFLKVYESAGRDYHKEGFASSVIHLQNAIIDILAKNDIPTSAVVPPNHNNNNNNGTPCPVVIETLPVVSESHSPSPLVVKLLQWVHGRTMSSVELLPLEALASAGRTLGRVDAALDQLQPESVLDKIRKRDSETFFKNTLSPWANHLLDHHSKGDDDDDDDDAGAGANHHHHHHHKPAADPSILTAARRFHQWDGRHTAELRQFLPCIRDDKRRGLVESVINAFCRQLQDQPFRRGINHGDFNDANICVDQDFAVSGVLDFGDSVER